MNFREWLNVLKRRWFVSLVSFLFCLSLAATAAAASPPSFMATTRLFATVEVTGSSSSYSAAAQYAQIQLKSLPGLATSADVLAPVIRSQQLNTTPDQLAKHVNATVLVDTLWMDIQVQDANAERSKIIADRIAQELLASWGRLTSAGDPSVRTRLSIVSPAEEPKTVSSPNSRLFVAAGAIAGIVLATLMSLLRDRTARHLTRPDDVRRTFGVPHIATVARQPTPHDAGVQRLTGALIEKIAPPICALLAPLEEKTSSGGLAHALASSLIARGWCVGILDLSGDATAGREHVLTSDQILAGSANLLATSSRDLLTYVVPPPDVEAGYVGSSASLPRLLARMREAFEVVLVAIPFSRDGSTAGILSRQMDIVLLLGNQATERSVFREIRDHISSREQFIAYVPFKQ